MRIREAVLSDAPKVTEVYVESWKNTYKGIIPDSYLKTMTAEKRLSQWENNIARHGNHVFIAETADGQIAGLADGSKRESNPFIQSGDLTSIYVAKKYQGKGAGKQLIKALFACFEEMEYFRIFVEVLDDNSSKHFYEQLGAVLYKKSVIEIQGKKLSLLIYEWEDIRHLSF